MHNSVKMKNNNLKKYMNLKCRNVMKNGEQLNKAIMRYYQKQIL